MSGTDLSRVSPSMSHHLLLPQFQNTLNLPLAASNIVITQYQLYAVEKWLVERNRQVTLLVVFTGDPQHEITLNAYAPDPALSKEQADQHWQTALAHLRADGAKQKQTPHGVLMVTSLAHFRSDYTIVHIPGGHFLPVKDQLYANINLLRMGCSGRSALTLQDPSDTTKERFISAYSLPDTTLSPPLPTSAEHLPIPPPLTQTQSYSASHRPGRPSIRVIGPTPNHSWASPERHPNQSTSSLPTQKGKLHHAKTKEPYIFIATVLELVKLVQAGLAIFGMYGNNPTLVLDGLLCDVTVEGIRKWIAEIGGPCVGLEPTERIADPMFVSALLSVVLSIRNKLAHLGFPHVLPRDPFLYPYAFSLALTAYIQSAAPPSIIHAANTLFQHQHHHYGAHTLGTPFTYIPPAPAPHNLYSAAAASAAAQVLPVGAILTRDLVVGITQAYDAKVKSESRKVRRVIKGTSKRVGGVDSDGPDGERDQRRSTLSISLTSNEAAASSQVGATGAGGVGVGPGIGSSGGQILSGIGNLASGLGLGGGACDAAAIVNATVDLAGFVAVVVGSGTGKDGTRKSRRKSRERRESIELGAMVGYAYGPAKDAIVAGSVKALWSGRVADAVRMREAAADTNSNTPDVSKRAYGSERERIGERWKRERLTMGVASDGDADEGEKDVLGNGNGRSTEEESDIPAHNVNGSAGSFGGMWGGRVRGKLGNWAGLARKKTHSVDLSASPSAASSQRASKEPSPRPNPQPQASPRHSLPPQPSRLVIGPMSRRPSNARQNTGGSGAQSPTLPPMVFSGDGDRDADDDDLLSSGQVSPLSDHRPNPFNMLGTNPSTTATAEGSTTNLALALASAPTALNAQDYERTLTKLLAQKRPWSQRRLSQNARVSSWADPVSARGVLDEEDEDDESGGGGGGWLGRKRKRTRLGEAPYEDLEGEVEGEEGSDLSEARRSGGGASESFGNKWKRKEKARFHSLLSVVDGEGVLAQERMEEDSEDEDWEEEEMERRPVRFDPRRRRSFHDIESFRGLQVLSPERMRIDVEICGQLLIMWRREEHLQNVVACVQMLADSLSNTSTLLRQHYESHLPTLAALSAQSTILTAIDASTASVDLTTQATNTLRYSSQQLRVPELWQTASPSRRKVFALREKVFGTGGARRLPPGVHGAHGRFNRLQWTIDGRERLVDYLGRTESECGEEGRVDGEEVVGVLSQGEEEDVVEHMGIKPMWLLRFFTSWGARWTAAAGGGRLL
ncbi:hypothetical protein B0H34DRAFT_233731 [Crassisporium funariophilum]|nr:hypothetical protein B0H34DRAFT_233731 [Crassisporium funariophilum]